MTNLEKHLSVVYNYLTGEESILLDMRQGKGIIQQKYDELIYSILFLIEEYKNKKTVPKKLALCFVDISNYFYFNEQMYPEEERDRLEDAAHKISELANELFV